MPRYKHSTLTLAFILAIQILGVMYYVWYLTKHGYLPSPFVHDKYDTFMDFYNPLYWSDNDGRYTLWGSIYPPLNFLFLQLYKFLFIENIGSGDSFSLRDASIFATIIFLVFSYLAVPLFSLRSKLWINFSTKEKVLLYFIFILSTPMLFTLERGNLIIFTLVFLALALGKNGLFRIVCFSILINLKPYFALLLLFYIIKRDWRNFWLSILFSLLLFVITGILLDSHFLLLFSNLLNFAQSSSIFSVKEMLSLPSSISAISYLLNFEAVQRATKYSYYFNLHAVAIFISIVKWIFITWILIALIKKFNTLSDTQILAVLVVVITNFGTWVGGYSIIFYFLLLPVFLTFELRNYYIFILLFLYLPLDFIPLYKETIGEQHSYITNSIVVVHWTLGLGSILKPFLNFALMLTLLFEISTCPTNGARIDSPSL